MGISKGSRRSFSLLLSAAFLFAFIVVAGTLSPRTVLAQPVPNAGKEPPGDPIVYDVTPKEGAIIAGNQLGRAGATIETRRDADLVRAAIFVDGRRRPSDLS